jgi:two-component system sensor histidine kinase and response regulator WspE
MSQLDLSMLDLFREEARAQTATLGQGLLDLESDPGNPQKIEPLMRAAHSLKGAARIVGFDGAVGLTHGMEEVLVAAQHGRIRLTPADIDTLLQGSDILAGLAEVRDAEVAGWGVGNAALADLLERLDRLGRGESAPVVTKPPTTALVPAISAEPIPAGDENPLFDLFREELRVASLTLRDRLPALAESADAALLDDLTRGVQSIKGAARLVRLDRAAGLAGRVEAILSSVRQGEGRLDLAGVGVLTRAAALFAALLPHDAEAAGLWLAAHEGEWADADAELARLATVPQTGVANRGADRQPAPQPARLPVGPVVEVAPEAPPPVAAEPEAVVRVTAESLNRLMSLAGESLVQARWLQPFAAALQQLKKHQDHLAGILGAAGVGPLAEEASQQIDLCRQTLARRIGEFEDHAAAAEDLNTRLYREVIVSRMRPFSDGAVGFPRMVRDMARHMNKQVRLEIDGMGTEVDRDILEKLEAPLTHLIRNAVDHGIEMPADRVRAGKSEQGVVRLEVHHRAGMLAVNLRDDGAGIDLERLRRKVVERNMTSAEMSANLTEAELLEFLFLPGFTTASQVTEYSGRGVGLDVVQDTIRRIGGSVRITSRAGRGTNFHLQLPVTLSVLRAVLVDIAGEPYAFPHNRIDRLLRVPRPTIRSLEHRQFVTVDGQNVGLVVAAQLLDLEAVQAAGDDLPVVLLSDASGHYGLIVEAFRGEQDLVVRPLDPRLGKVPNVSAAAILDDGVPVLIADVEDLIRSMDHFIQSGSLRRSDRVLVEEKRKKHVLVVDDSITVREVERQLLRNAGYRVDVAVDGQDGLNQVRAGTFDLLVTDVDMPRMTGLDLVRAVRNQEQTRNLPVIIISYKDREEDRMRGLELGANYYLTKSSFHDNTFLRAVADLIGEA